MASIGVRAIGVMIVVCVGVFAHADDTVTSDLLVRIRNDDTRAVRSSLKGGADANTRDANGATALMHAAAFASAECMRVLLDARADVNASTGAGATALMWATGDAGKIRLLLDRVCAPLIAAGACRKAADWEGQPLAREVTAYVSADRPFSEPVMREYERRSGVRMNVVYDTEETKSTGLANRLLAEKARPQADVFWSKSERGSALSLNALRLAGQRPR